MIDDFIKFARDSTAEHELEVTQLPGLRRSHNFVLSNPKGACTTLTNALWAATHPHPIPPGEKLHKFSNRNLRLHCYGSRRANEIFRSSVLFKFAFMRNPWSQLVSGFLNKFVYQLRRPGLQVINELGVSSDSIRFRDFVCFVQSKGRFYIQPVLASSSDILCPHLKQPIKAVRFDSVDKPGDVFDTKTGSIYMA